MEEDWRWPCLGHKCAFPDKESSITCQLPLQVKEYDTATRKEVGGEDNLVKLKGGK